MKSFDFYKLLDDVSKSDYADSLILIYKDTLDVRGPFLTIESQWEAFEKAEATGRDYIFRPWNHKG